MIVLPVRIGYPVAFGGNKAELGHPQSVVLACALELRPPVFVDARDCVALWLSDQVLWFGCVQRHAIGECARPMLHQPLSSCRW